MASAKRAIDERGLDEAALLHLDGNVRVRLGYLLVLHGELNEAESTLGPLLRHALTNTTGSSEHGLFTGPNVEKRAFLQEAATYVGWSRAFRRDWTGASDAHAVGAALALPRDASGCNQPRWRVQDGWLTPEDRWTVHPLAVKAPILRFGNVVAPICAVRRRFGAKDRPGAGPGWCGASEPSLSPGLVRLVEIPNAFLGGKDGSALWQRAPHCVFFAGEVTSSGAPPPDWGDAAANSGLTDKDVVLESEPEDTITIESALLLFDASEAQDVLAPSNRKRVAVRPWRCAVCLIATEGGVRFAGADAEHVESCGHPVPPGINGDDHRAFAKGPRDDESPRETT